VNHGVVGLLVPLVVMKQELKLDIEDASEMITAVALLKHKVTRELVLVRHVEAQLQPAPVVILALLAKAINTMILAVAKSAMEPKSAQETIVILLLPLTYIAKATMSMEYITIGTQPDAVSVHV
jgi:hypothetical protein